MHVTSDLRIALVVVTLCLCSCQSTPQTMPPDATVAVFNRESYPEYAWGDRAAGAPTSGPQLIIREALVYPLALVGTGLRGTAKIGWVIEADGSTSHVQILAATNRYFGAAAKAAVEKWKFVPAQSQGKPIPIITEYMFTFEPAK